MEEKTSELVFVNPVEPKTRGNIDHWRIGLLVTNGDIRRLYVQVDDTPTGIHRYDLVNLTNSGEFTQHLKVMQTTHIEYASPGILDDIKTNVGNDPITCRERLSNIISGVVFYEADPNRMPIKEFQYPGIRQRVTQLQFACMCFGYTAAATILRRNNSFMRELAYIKDEFPVNGMYAEANFKTNLGTPYPVECTITWKYRISENSLVDNYQAGIFSITKYIDVWNGDAVYGMTSFNGVYDYFVHEVMAMALDKKIP